MFHSSAAPFAEFNFCFRCWFNAEIKVTVTFFLCFPETWQANNVGRINEHGLILPAFFALVFENELEYHYLYVRINSSDDQATSYINLVGF